MSGKVFKGFIDEEESDVCVVRILQSTRKHVILLKREIHGFGEVVELICEYEYAQI